MIETKFVVMNQSITDDNVFWPIAILDTYEDAKQFAKGCATGNNVVDQIEEVIYIESNRSNDDDFA